MISAQFDFNAGFDPSSLSSMTAAQYLQMVQQLAPLSNVGCIIVGAGASLNSTIAQGTGSPSVTNNPRFARYIWLNTFNSASAPPTPYYYDASTGNWTSLSVADGSITNASISASAEIAVSKLADGAANEIVVTDSAGTGVEWKSIATLLAALNDSVPLTAIDDTGAAGAESFLRRVGSTVIWKTFTETVTAIQNALNGVPVTTLTPGANNTLLGTNSAGVVAFDTLDNIVANLSIGLAKISLGGASANDILRCDGTNWVKITPTLRIVANDTANGGIDAGVMGGGILFTIPHLLGAKPKIVRAVCRCNTIDNSFAVGDELDIFSLRNNSNQPTAGVSADGTNITVTLSTAASNLIPDKVSGTYANMTEASWNLVVYAWR